MRSKEWPLILFTVLSQMTTGAFIGLWTVDLWTRNRYDTAAIDRIIVPMLVVLVLLLGMGSSMAALHLGNPQRAFRVIANAKSSWLSREMLAGGVFGGLMAVYTLERSMRILPLPLRDGVALLAGLFGFALVYSMSRLYMLRTVPSWNTWGTPVAFFITSFLLGGVFIGAGITVLESPQSFQNDLLRAITLPVIGLAGIQLGTAAIGYRPPEHRMMLLARFALVVIGMGIFALYAAHAQTSWTKSLVVLAAVLVFVAETVGRFLFYDSYRGNLGEL